MEKGWRNAGDHTPRQRSDIAMAACSMTSPPPSTTALGSLETQLFRGANLQRSAQLQAAFGGLQSSAGFIKAEPVAPCSATRNLIQVRLQPRPHAQ